MKRFKKILAAAVFAAAALLPTFAREASFTGEDYEIRLFYNDTAVPGDAVFVRMKFIQNGKMTKADKARFNATTAVLELYNDEKRLDKAAFYDLEKDSDKTTRTMLAGIGLSSWWKSDANYHLTVKYNLYGEQPLEFDLPFGINNKVFESFTIEATQGMTNIQSDKSAEKMKQIERLNKVLYAVNPEGVHQTKPFVQPTTVTRRTSICFERRIYKYTNGKEVYSAHYGTDYGTGTGAKITSCADGKVMIAENRVSTGWSVCIEHLPGLYSLYYHMSEIKVKEGDTVKAGDLIGLSGATGFATGPHLHWEMRLNTVPVNPDFFCQDFTFDSVEHQ